MSIAFKKMRNELKCKGSSESNCKEKAWCKYVNGPKRKYCKKFNSDTKAELYKEAKFYDIKGRSKMNKSQLEKAVKKQRMSMGKFTKSIEKRKNLYKTTPIFFK